MCSGCVCFCVPSNAASASAPSAAASASDAVVLCRSSYPHIPDTDRLSAADHSLLPPPHTLYASPFGLSLPVTLLHAHHSRTHSASASSSPQLRPSAYSHGLIQPPPLCWSPLHSSMLALSHPVSVISCVPPSVWCCAVACGARRRRALYPKAPAHAQRRTRRAAEAEMEEEHVTTAHSRRQAKQQPSTTAQSKSGAPAN